MAGLQRSLRLGALGSAIAAALLLAAPGATAASKCGGSGGTRTQTFTCGPGEFISSAFAEAGSYVQRVRFQCSRLSGTTSTVTKESNLLGGNKPGYFGYSSGRGTCLGGEAVWSLETMCGTYVDRVTEIRCGPVYRNAVVFGMDSQSINAGGSGGTRTSLQCPDGQGIYKVTVKSGSWIDSITVACRKP